jgi:X-X-X-Leu-X-X-Gly heptad repeat protein
VIFSLQQAANGHISSESWNGTRTALEGNSSLQSVSRKGTIMSSPRQEPQGADQGIGRLAGKAQELAAGAAQKARDAASVVALQAQDTAAIAVEKTDDAISAVGQQLTALGGAVRKNAPQQGTVGSAAASVANNLQAGGRYLEEHGLGDMGKDVKAIVRQYPMQSLAVGFGLGCLLGMAYSRS